jgi:hypothetical protein
MDLAKSNPGAAMMIGNAVKGLSDWLSGKSDAEIAALDAGTLAGAPADIGPAVAASVFVAGMLVGADSMSRAVAVPTYIADVIVAVALLSMLVAMQLTRYRLRWR